MAVPHDDKENLRLCQILRNANVKLKPCPFCGANINEYPLTMTIKPVHSEEYLLEKLKKGHFLGSSNHYVVKCPVCGAQGSSDTSVVFAVNKWNNQRKKQGDNYDLYRGYCISREDMRRIAATEKPCCCDKCELNKTSRKDSENDD